MEVTCIYRKEVQMKKIQIFILVLMLCLTSFLSCSQHSTEDKKESKGTQQIDISEGRNNTIDATQASTIAEEQEVKVPIENDKIENLKEWIPESFDGKGKLVLRWSLEVKTPNNERYYGVTSIPGGWLMDTNRYPKDSDLSLKMAVMDPQTGGILENSIGGDIRRRIGPTNGKYIFGDTLMQGAAPRSCWNLSNKTIRWKVNDATIHGESFSKMSIVSKMLIYISVNSSDVVHISRFNPDTGEIIWKQPFKDMNLIDYAISDDSAYLLFDNSELKCIELASGQIKDTGIDSSKFSAIEVIQESLSVLTSDGFLVQFDSSTYEKKQEIQLPISEISKPMLFRQYSKIHLDIHETNISPLGDSLLLLTIEPEKTRENFYVLDTINQNIQELPYKIVYTLNDQLISYSENTETDEYDDSTIQALNPTTLKPTWWINLEEEELGENPRVIWCDWRGVLVMSDTKLACYMAPEGE